MLLGFRDKLYSSTIAPAAMASTAEVRGLSPTIKTCLRRAQKVEQGSLSSLAPHGNDPLLPSWGKIFSIPAYFWRLRLLGGLHTQRLRLFAEASIKPWGAEATKRPVLVASICSRDEIGDLI